MNAIIIVLFALIQCCRSENILPKQSEIEISDINTQSIKLNNAIKIQNYSLEDKEKQVDYRYIDKTSQLNRVLESQQNNEQVDKSSNYSHQILDNLDIKCQPMNCSNNCCDKDGLCPIDKINCFYYKCENFMCEDGGCCIKGVCRSKSDCDMSRISRYICMGIIFFLSLFLIRFKSNIEKLFKDKQWYNKNISISKEKVQQEIVIANSLQTEDQQTRKNNQSKSNNNIQRVSIKKVEEEEDSDSCNINESSVKKEDFTCFKSTYTPHPNDLSHKKNDSEFNIQPSSSDSSRNAHKVPSGVSDLYKSKFY